MSYPVSVARMATLAAWVGLLAACSPTSRSVYVDLHTDLAAGVDFVAVRVELSDTSFASPGVRLTAPTHEVDGALDYEEGARVAELEVSHCEPVYIRVTLLDAAGRSRGQRVAELPAGCEARVVHVAISLACARVTCPGDGDPADATTCHEGRCVPPTCLADACGEFCADDAACDPATRPCATAACTEGGCLEVDGCGAGEVCRAEGCVVAPRCGDGACDPSTETPCGCPMDCEAVCPASCRDGACGADEGPDTCPEDCGPPDPVCGDAICEASEACPADCPAAPGCGDAVCAPTESCPACPECCPAMPVCGDAVCDAGEDCAACPECCDAGCGDGRCDDAERASCACEVDCGLCTTCGDDRCDAGEACPADCTAERGVCGDDACELDLRETCGTCQRDCGWCIGFPGIGQAAACRGTHGTGGDVCASIAEAYTQDAVNVGYYPLMAATTTELVSGEGRAPLATLMPGDLFAAQSTRNPGCLDAPPFRPARDGWMFGYVVAGTGVETRVGWVRAADLSLDLFPENHACVDGVAGTDFAIRTNAYSRNPSCEPLDCVGPARSCRDANPAGQGAGDCDGATASRDAQVDADTLLLRYAQDGPPRRYLHRDDRVRVLYEAGGWAFVTSLDSSSPVLSPPGSRGWVLADNLR
ncbi:MAG: hypothetical protein H6719_30400 [Sandaracinaceae bacterium]|nr:hypothetical protein [Sandaracinaceae bacterium]